MGNIIWQEQQDGRKRMKININWKDNRIKLYIEAGLAVLLILTLTLAGASGMLSSRESGQETQSAKETHAEGVQQAAGEDTEKETHRRRRRKRPLQASSIPLWAAVR